MKSQRRNQRNKNRTVLNVTVPRSLIGKGFDANPQNIVAGRPKGSRNRATIYREHLEKKGKNGQLVDDIVMAAIDKALTGDITALKELMDSGYGKVADKVLTAETSEEKLERDITTEVLKHVPLEVLEAMAENGKTD